MILLLQSITRVVTLVLLLVLALAGLAVAVFSVPEPESGLAELAELAGLPLAEDEVGSFLESVEEGELEAGPAIAGFGAAVVALLLIVGALWPRRERVVALPDEEGSSDQGRGRLAARRRPLGQMAGALAERVREAESLSLRVRPRRRRPGGTLRVKARLAADGDADDVAQRIERELEPLAEPFSLRRRVSARLPRRTA